MATVIDELVALLGYEIEGEEKLARFNRGLDTLGQKAEMVSAAMIGLAAKAAAALAAGMGLLGGMVLNTSAQFETYLTTLETIEGSAEKAEAALSWVTNFAKTTPFEVDELTQAFVKLRSYGLDPMDGSMTKMGDTAAGMGKSLDQVVEAVADASTFQFERLRELGIVASQAGDQVTFSWTENGKSMTKTIKKTSADVTKFLYDVWEKKFGGAMVRQSKTWRGMWSNLGDIWTGFQKKIGDAGFFDVVKNKLADLLDILKRWEYDGTLDRIAQQLSYAFVTVANAVGIVMDRIGNHVKFLSENFEELEPTIKSIGVAFGLMMLKAFPLLFVLGGLVLAIDDFLTYLEGGESVIGNFIEWLREIIPGTKEVEDAVMAMGAAVAAGLALAFVISPSTIALLVGKLIGALLFNLGPALVAGLATLSTSVGAGLAAAFAFLATPVGWAVILAGIAAALVAYFWDDLVKLWNEIDFAELGRKIGDGILAGLRASAAAIRDFVASLMPEGWIQGSNAASAGAKIGGMIGNASANADKMANGQAAAVNDNRTQTTNTTVHAPVTVQVQQPSAAPGAVGQAVGQAVGKAAAPSRMQGGGGGSW